MTPEENPIVQDEPKVEAQSPDSPHENSRINILFKIFGVLAYIFAVFSALTLLSPAYWNGTFPFYFALLPLLGVIGLSVGGYGLFALKRWVIPILYVYAASSLIQFVYYQIKGEYDGVELAIAVIQLLFYVGIALLAYRYQTVFVGNSFHPVFSTIFIIYLFAVPVITMLMTKTDVFDLLDSKGVGVPEWRTQLEDVLNKRPINQLSSDILKTYRNDEYGFEVQVPDVYMPIEVSQYGVETISFYEGEQGIFDNLRFQISIDTDPESGADPLTVLKYQPEKILDGPTPIVVSGIEAKQYKIEWENGGISYPYELITFEYAGKVYAISNAGLYPDSEEFSGFISALRLNSVQAPVGWQIYRDDKYGFEFNHSATTRVTENSTSVTVCYTEPRWDLSPEQGKCLIISIATTTLKDLIDSYRNAPAGYYVNLQIKDNSIIIGERKWSEIKYISALGTNATELMTVENNQSYLINFGLTDSDRNTVFSSFKFITR